MKRVRKNPRLNPTHLNLFLFLVRRWNVLTFPPLFFIGKEEISGVTKIDANGTFMNDLRDRGYLAYMASRILYKRSYIKMVPFEFGALLSTESYEYQNKTFRLFQISYCPITPFLKTENTCPMW